MTSSAASPERSGKLEGSKRVLGLDWFDWACLAGTAFVSMIVLGKLLLLGRGSTGADGVYPVDQLQYLTWVRQASVHGLIGNEFDLAVDTRTFLHPGFLISGLVYRWTGLSLEASYAVIWKPFSVFVVFAGALLYARRLTHPVWPRRVALALALFAVPPWSGFMKWTDVVSKPTNFAFDFISGEMWTGQYLQGYAMTAIATFMVPLLLLLLERQRRNGYGPWLWVCAIGAMVVMWLQPWQGAELLLIVAMVELWCWLRRGERPWLGFVPVFIFGAAPAVYYALLGRYDAAWKLAAASNAADQNPLWDWPLWAVAATLAPLGIPALLALRAKDNDWQGLAARFWPLAIGIVFFLPVGTFPFHSVQGLSIPLAVLAVQGLTVHRPSWVPAPKAWWVLPALFLMIVPGTVHKTRNSYDSINREAFPWSLSEGEARALSFLERDPRPGGVMTDEYSGLLVPPFAGREAYIGPFSWTPESLKKLVRVTWLFQGVSAAKPSQEYVDETGVRFIFQACKPGKVAPRSLVPQIGPRLESVHRFGCSVVYVMKPSPNSDRVSALVGGPEG